MTTTDFKVKSGGSLVYLVNAPVCGSAEMEDCITNDVRQASPNRFSPIDDSPTHVMAEIRVILAPVGSANDEVLDRPLKRNSETSHWS